MDESSNMTKVGENLTGDQPQRWEKVMCDEAFVCPTHGPQQQLTDSGDCQLCWTEKFRNYPEPPKQQELREVCHQILLTAHAVEPFANHVLVHRELIGILRKALQ